MTQAAAPMAKKPKTPGPKPTPEGPREAMIAIRCREDYKAWVLKFSKHKRIMFPQLVDIALARFAEQEGFEAPPER